MRPVVKPSWPTDPNGQPKLFKPHTLAKPDLEIGIGSYCSYCEEFHSNLQVEHVISQHQDDSKVHDWENFLLGCSRCNGRDNKTNKNVNLDEIHFPHRDNTFLSFNYLEGGKVIVNPVLESTIEGAKAKNLLELVGLDKYPGSLAYKDSPTNDMRWAIRRTQWEKAQRKLIKFVDHEIEALEIAEFAAEKGYFSIWYTLFAEHPEVLKSLIAVFKGTAEDCFDPHHKYQPIPRIRK